jgi:hypothetical protein
VFLIVTWIARASRPPIRCSRRWRNRPIT